MCEVGVIWGDGFQCLSVLRGEGLGSVVVSCVIVFMCVCLQLAEELGVNERG